MLGLLQYVTLYLVIQGRLLHILPGKVKDEEAVDLGL